MHQNLTSLPISDVTYGVRNVSYYVTSTGHAVIDGDVLYGTEEELLQNSLGNRATVRVRSVSIRSDMRWDNGNVIYKYTSNEVETKVKSIFEGAIQRWSTAAPYLRFTKLANGNVSSSGVIIIMANDCDGCHSSVGVMTSDMRMNLQQACNSVGTYPSTKKDLFIPYLQTSVSTCGTDEATHELGHALGKWKALV